ncbi:MAG: thiamine diphosphokinase [Oscillospiraceae bacterium]|nr:thiamine diphosphokinase [Oscillospiraceae bacterium]
MGAQIEKRAVIFGAVPCSDWGFLKPHLLPDDYIICADGGIHNARAAGLQPDVMIGDWDSGGAPVDGIPFRTLPAEKNETDLQAAAALALANACREMLFCGCTGGRLDHTAANLLLLEWAWEQGGSARMLDTEHEVRFLAGGSLTIDPCAYHYLSIIPLDRCVEGVTLEGVRYPLKNAVLTRGDTLSVSNEPTGDTLRICVSTGRILIIQSQKEKNGTK